MSSPAAAAEIVVPVDGEPVVGALVSVGADGRVTFRVEADTAATEPPESDRESAGSLRSIQLNELVRWGHPVEPRPQILVLLADGGRLVTAAAWSGGAPVRLEGDDFVVLTDTWDEIRLPRWLVHWLVFAQRSHPRERAALAERVHSSRGEGDTVLLTNEDRLTGTLSELGGGSLTVVAEAGTAKLPLSRVKAVIFGTVSSGTSPAPLRQETKKLAIGLRDGSLLYGHRLTANEENIELTSASGLRLEGGSVEEIALLQSLDGPVVYLSDLEPTDYRHVPYLSIEWPYQRDQNVLGEPLTVGGKRYLKGLGMHSAARLTYRLDRNYRRFDAMLAVDDSAGRHGSVTFGVYVLRDGQWAEAFTSGIVRGGEAPRPVSVDVSGADGLTLTVDFADRGDELDHADWLDARLIKNEP